MKNRKLVLLIALFIGCSGVKIKESKCLLSGVIYAKDGLKEKIDSCLKSKIKISITFLQEKIDPEFQADILYHMESGAKNKVDLFLLISEAKSPVLWKNFNPESEEIFRIYRNGKLLYQSKSLIGTDIETSLFLDKILSEDKKRKEYE